KSGRPVDLRDVIDKLPENGRYYFVGGGVHPQDDYVEDWMAVVVSKGKIKPNSGTGSIDGYCRVTIRSAIEETLAEFGFSVDQLESHLRTQWGYQVNEDFLTLPFEFGPYRFLERLVPGDDHWAGSPFRIRIDQDTLQNPWLLRRAVRKATINLLRLR